MGIDDNERSKRGGAGGIIGDFLSISKELVGKEAEIGESPRTRAATCPIYPRPAAANTGTLRALAAFVTVR